MCEGFKKFFSSCDAIFSIVSAGFQRVISIYDFDVMAKLFFVANVA
jgi:hypothetical protein